MKDVNSRTLLVSVAALLVCWQVIIRVDHRSVFDFIPLSLVTLIGVSTLVWIFICDRKCFLIKRDKRELVPSAVGSFALLFLLVAIFLFRLRDNTPSVFKCVSIKDAGNTVSIDFRENGTFKLKVTDGFWEVDIYRGQYTIQNNLIILKNCSFSADLMNPVLLRRLEYKTSYNRKSETLDTTWQTVVYQWDTVAGQEVLNKFRFRVLD